MTSLSSESTYSFSMINLLKFMSGWDWDRFDDLMAQAGTNQVELVPSMLLGMDWDQQIEDESGRVQQSLGRLMQRYQVRSIQSLTFGLQINLADQLINHPILLRRLKALKVLASATGCFVLILGSPGQKKRLAPTMTIDDHKQRFLANCRWIARTLGPDISLSLEHNTITQGAEYCNTLGEMIDIAKTLRGEGLFRLGINLDTKCLIQELGSNVHVDRILADYGLAELITSIQVSFDYLVRNAPTSAKDHQQLLAVSRARSIPLSLEEFGLEETQFPSFIDAWNSLL